MTRRLDLTGATLFAALAAIAASVGGELLHEGYFTPTEFAAELIVGVAFLAVSVPGRTTKAPHNTQVHGAAEPASESEAETAARGLANKAAIHDTRFRD